MLAVTLTVAFSAEAQQIEQRRWSLPYPVSEARLGPRTAWNPAVAFNGEIYLVVWDRVHEVVGVRIDAQGQLIDRAPFLISDGISYSEQPCVVWNGERFLIVWHANWDTIRGRFFEEGTGLSPEFQFSSGRPSGMHIASNGSTALVVPGGAKGGVLVSRDGSLTGISLGQSYGLSVASNGTDYLIAAASQSPPYSTLMRVRGDKVETTAVLSPTVQGQLVSNGSGYLLFSGKQPFIATPISSEGTVDGSPIVIGNVPSYFVVKGVAENGRVTVLWHATDSADTFGALMMTRITGRVASSPVSLGRTGKSLDAAGRLFVWEEADAIHHMHLDRPGSIEVTSLSALHQLDTRSIPTSYGWFSVWRESMGFSSSTIRATVVDTALSRGAEIIVSSAERWNGAPAVAASDQVVVVAWQGEPQGRPFGALYARRFTPAGVPLDEAPVVLAPGIPWQHEPLVVGWTGRYFVVAFAAGGDPAAIGSIRMSEDGVVIDSPPRAVATSQRGSYLQSNLAFARAGDVSLLVWQDGEQPRECRITCEPVPLARIEGIRFSEHGEPLDPSARILTPDTIAWMPAVAALGGRFLVAWRSEAGVLAQRVDRDFTAGPPALVALASIDPLYYFSEGRRVSVTATDREYLIAWDDDFKHLMASVSPEGNVVGAPQVLADTRVHTRADYENPSVPHVSARGNDLLLTYSLFRYEEGGVMRAFFRGYTARARLRGARR